MQALFPALRSGRLAGKLDRTRAVLYDPCLIPKCPRAVGAAGGVAQEVQTP